MPDRANCYFLVIFSAALFGGGFGLGALYAIVPVHVVTGPVVHLANGRVGTAFLSLGTNTVLTVVSYLTAALAGAGNSRVLFASLGLVSANIIDIGVLSRKTVKEPYRPLRGAQVLLPSAVSVVPRIDANFRGFAIVWQF